MQIGEQGRHAGGNGAEVAEQGGRRGGCQGRARQHPHAMAPFDVTHLVRQHASQGGMLLLV